MQVISSASAAPKTAAIAATRGTVGEVFLAFLRLGLISFGGPIAHLGYFRNELVLRRKWIDEAGYGDVVALCQFLPGPASSQVGYVLGLLRGGAWGGIAAWVAFTAPSAVLMLLFAVGAAVFGGSIGTGITHGLKIVAVAVIAQAVWGMARTLAPDRARASIALLSVLIAAFAPSAAGQIVAIAIGGLFGLWLCRDLAVAPSGDLSFPIARRTGLLCVALYFGLLFGLPLAVSVTGSHVLAVFEAFYRSGALVFGGGHVVLPLLQAAVVAPGWVNPDAFLAGYGAAQAVPGPLFTLAAYLGAVMPAPPNGILGGLLSLVALACPGLVLVTGALPFWNAFRTKPHMQSAMRGANAAVVGVLATALYNPVWVSAIFNQRDFAAAAIGFALLTVWSTPPWFVVVLLTLAGIGLQIT